MIDIKIDKTKVRRKKKPNLTPYLVIGGSVLIVAIVAGAVLLVATRNSQRHSGKSQEQVQKPKESEYESELKRILTKGFKLKTRLPMELEMSDLKSGGDGFEAVTVHQVYYQDMSFEELIAEYKKHFPARWHKMKKDHWPSDRLPLPPEYE